MKCPVLIHFHLLLACPAIVLSDQFVCSRGGCPSGTYLECSNACSQTSGEAACSCAALAGSIVSNFLPRRSGGCPNNCAAASSCSCGSLNDTSCQCHCAGAGAQNFLQQGVSCGCSSNNGGLCQYCAAGKFSNFSSCGCEQCAKGTYSDIGASTCLACVVGKPCNLAGKQKPISPAQMLLFNIILLAAVHNI